MKREARLTGVATVDIADQRILDRCSGFIHCALRVPMPSSAQIAMGSGSKAFTALAVMRLVEDGELRLEQPMRGLLDDDLPLIDNDVTIEQLLAHTPGIGDYLDEDRDWAPSDFVLSHPVHTLTTAEAFLPMLHGNPQKFAPGERFAYCNGGHIVLAVLLERATGSTYQDVRAAVWSCRDRHAAPEGLKVMRIDLNVGVLLSSATLETGTSALASG